MSKIVVKYSTTVRNQGMRIFFLAILAFALCSRADLKPAADDDYDNLYHAPGSGDPS
jgi:hypothetical protein